MSSNENHDQNPSSKLNNRTESDLVELFRTADEKFDSFYDQDHQMKRVLKLLNRSHLIDGSTSRSSDDSTSTRSTRDYSSLVSYSSFMTIDGVSIEMDTSSNAQIINSYCRHNGVYHNPYGPAVIKLVEYGPISSSSLNKYHIVDKYDHSSNNGYSEKDDYDDKSYPLNGHLYRYKYLIQQWLHGRMIKSYTISFDRSI